MRAQANLPVLAVALAALTALAGVGVAFADGALAGADRDPAERRAADAAAERLVAADAPTTLRANLLDRGAAATLTPARLDALAPPVAGRAVRVRLGGRTLFERGDADGGTTARRIVLAGERTARTRTVNATAGSVVLPRRTATVTLAVRTGAGNVTAVRANDRVVLRDPSGIRGPTTVRTSRYTTTRLSFETRPGANGTVDGRIRITAYPVSATKATLAVTVR